MNVETLSEDTEDVVALTDNSDEEQPIFNAYSEVVNDLAELGIYETNGVLHRTNVLKLDLNDAADAVFCHRASKLKKGIAHSSILKFIKNWLLTLAMGRHAQWTSKVKFDASVDDQWDRLMSVAFKRDHFAEKCILKHMVWLVKRKVFRLPVAEEHRPLFLNIFGGPDVGKTKFLKEYLLSPIYSAYVAELNDISQYIENERYYHVYGDHYAIIFSEIGKGERVDVAQMKAVIEQGLLRYQSMYTRFTNQIPNNATLFATSNTRLRELLKDENPRKWAELEFPTRSISEIEQEYLPARDEIDVFDIWKCINENEPSELLLKWPEIRPYIYATCSYVTKAEQWILNFVKVGGKEVVGDHLPLYEDFRKEITGSGKREFLVSPQKFSEIAVRLGFEPKRRSSGRGYILSQTGYENVLKRYAEVYPNDVAEVEEGMEKRCAGKCPTPALQRMEA